MLGGCTHFIHGRRHSHPYNARTKHVRFLPTRQTSQCRDGARRVFADQADIACTERKAKRREVLGESHDGWDVPF